MIASTEGTHKQFVLSLSEPPQEEFLTGFSPEVPLASKAPWLIAPWDNWPESCVLCVGQHHWVSYGDKVSVAFVV